MQFHSGENGTATLAMILAYYKKYVSFESVQNECLASRNNTSVKQLIKAGEFFGLSAEILNSPTIEDIKSAKAPLVIRSGKDYYIITGIKNGKAYLNSTFTGKNAISTEALNQMLNGGTVISFYPSADFAPEGKPEDFFAPIKQRFRENKKVCTILLMLYAVSAVATIVMLYLSRRMMDDCLNSANPKGVGLLLIFMFLVVALDIFSAIITPLYIFRHGWEMAARSGIKLYKMMLRLPMHFFETHFIGDLIERMMVNITLGQEFLSNILPKLVDFLIAFVFLLILFFYAPALAAILLAIEAAFVVASIIVRSRIGIITKSLNVMQSSISANTLNGINLIDTIKTSGSERSYFKVWCESETAFDNEQKKLLRLNALAVFINDVSDFLASGLLLFVGAFMIMAGEFTFGGMAAFQLIINQLKKTMRKSLFMIDDYQKIKANIDRSDDILNRNTEKITELNDEPDKLLGDIIFDHVTFRYNKGDAPALDDVSFEMNKGEIIALVGKTGSGKSTILKLLSNLYEPESGNILIDGKRVDEIPDIILKSSIATVDQEITMYVDTVKNNLKLWDETIEDFEMILASKDAQVFSRITSSPEGYEEVIQENGRNFSGGELQRMALARALSQEPTILLLDEFTSALDVITESRVFDAIRKRNAGICIIAAHRLSTVMLCDRVMVIEKGKIAEEGSPEELYERDGKFRQLVDNG